MHSSKHLDEAERWTEADACTEHPPPPQEGWGCKTLPPLTVRGPPLPSPPLSIWLRPTPLPSFRSDPRSAPRTPRTWSVQAPDHIRFWFFLWLFFFFFWTNELLRMGNTWSRSSAEEGTVRPPHPPSSPPPHLPPPPPCIISPHPCGERTHTEPAQSLSSPATPSLSRRCHLQVRGAHFLRTKPPNLNRNQNKSAPFPSSCLQLEGIVRFYSHLCQFKICKTGAFSL